MSQPDASRPRNQAPGWGISLRCYGRTLADLRLRGDGPLRAGEDPRCALVVPGLGAAAVLARGDELLRVAGLGGVVHRGGEVLPYPPASGLVLAPGDRATLTLDEHPEITLELRREAFERLPLATLLNVRELARQLALGAGLLAGLVLLVRHEVPVNLLAVRGEPDAADSALVRAMFVAAAHAPRSEPRLDLQQLAPPPAPVPASAAEPEPVAPVPLVLASADVVPVPVSKADAQPTRARARRRDRDREASALGLLNFEDSAGLFGVPGGVVGGVVDQAREGLLAERIPAEPGFLSPGSGANSHAQVGGEVTRGVATGLAAVAPATRCEDPSRTPRSQLDVVFVVDVSTTMTFMLERIERQLALVDAEARASGLDARYGLVVFVDDVELGNGGQPYADLAALQADLARWRAFTASNRQIGSEAANLDWPENTLDAVHTAATGFAWRPADTTLRLVVHATDDDFGEAPAIQSGQAIRHTYAQTVAALRAAEVRMFSFAAKVGGECECLDVRPGLFTRFHGRASLPDATGGAVFDIDEVASGKLSFVAAVLGAIQSGVCARYPLSPFGGAH